MALMTVGALRGVLRRTLIELSPSCTLNTGSAIEVSSSAACPSITSLKLYRNTPWEPTMLLFSSITAESALLMSASLRSGKSLILSWWFAPNPGLNVVESAAGLPLPSTRRSPGSVWLNERLSAPALKWQVAQAVLPSLPNCISQKNALPSAIAALLLRITLLSSAAVGPGMGIVFSDARFLFPPPPPVPPPPELGLGAMPPAPDPPLA